MAKKKATEEFELDELPQVELVGNNFDKLRTLTANINKHYKKDVVKQGEDIVPVRKVPTMEPMRDYVLDGGNPIGRFIESLGQEHSGKTRNALHDMAEFQKYCYSCHTPRALTAVWKKEKDKTKQEQGFPVLLSCVCSNCKKPQTKIQAFVDVEGTADPRFMEMLGVDLGGVIYTKPDLPSTAVDITDMYLRNPSIGLIVFDSVGSMSADKEVENAIVDDKMNQNALFLNKAMRKWQMALNANAQEDSNTGTTMIVVNQSYSTIGNYSTEVAAGGRGLKHGKGMSTKTRIREKVYVNADRDRALGVHIVIENTKNKTGMPYRKGEYYLNLDPTDPIGYCGVDIPLQLMELGIMSGTIEQRGAWLYFGNEKWNGKQAFLTDLRDDKPSLDFILGEVYKLIMPK
jgi:RecA/RadA recombinase